MALGDAGYVVTEQDCPECGAPVERWQSLLYCKHIIECGWTDELPVDARA